ncbi:MAG TPA: TRAP transporter substrate-binding protein [Rhodopila sp.]|nr:TRAP transporter substrate-binding protein [Rhodopila sp.]
MPPNALQKSAAGLPRRIAIASSIAGLAVPFVARPAAAAATTWRIGHNAPITFPLHRRLVETATAIQAASHGQMDIRILPDSEAGSPLGLLQQVRRGQIDAALLSCQILANDLPSLAAPRCAFAFSNYDTVWAAMDGALGAFIRRSVAQRIGPVLMERCWDFGFRHISTYHKPLHTAADIRGVRIRTQPDTAVIGCLQALQALPLATSLDELVESLQSHSLDGQESLLVLLQLLNLDQLQTNLALTHHVWDGLWLCISAEAWSTLPPRLQAVVADACNQGALNQRRDTAAAATQARDAMAQHGMDITQPDLASFRDKLRAAGYYRDVRQKMEHECWTLLEQYAGRLAG